MIRLIEAKSYRCLKYVKQAMSPFQVLVGPNASGKSTFLDVILFLADLVSKGFEKSLSERSENLKDLLWKREGNGFELAIEMIIPEELKKKLSADYSACRYEVSIGIDLKTGENSILAEKVLLKQREKKTELRQPSLFPSPHLPPDTLITSRIAGAKTTHLPPDTLITSRIAGAKTIVNKVYEGNDNFYDETGKGWGDKSPALREWLKEKGLASNVSSKPDDPKEGFKKALREAKIPQSSHLYSELAKKVSLKGCKDPSFNELKQILSRWFHA